MKDHPIQLPPGVTIRHFGEGKLGALVREKDWKNTKLGAFEAWPETLKGYVRMILTLPTPAIIFWGEDQIQIYNDGYAEIMGPRHPKYLGSTYKECWPDTYPTIYPWMRRVLDNGDIVEVDKTLIPVTRKGFEEEAYFTFTFSPLNNDQGKIDGILQLVNEVTETVIWERRQESLRALVPTAEGAMATDIIRVLSADQRDLQFAALFLPDAMGQLKIKGSFQLPEELTEEALKKVAQTVFSTNEVVQVSERVMALPLLRSKNDGAKGVLILGASPKLVFDQSYRSYLESISREAAYVISMEEEKLARSKVEEERNALHSFFMQAPVAVCVQEGPNHKYVLTNNNYLELIGNKKDIVGMSVREAIPELVGQPFYQLLDHVYQTGETYIGREAPLSLTNENGHSKNIYCNFVYKARRNHRGVIDGIVTVATDVTDMVLARKKVEKLAEDLQASIVVRDDFLSLASHELKTPLTSLKLQAQILERLVGDDKLTPERAVNFSKQSDRQILRLERLIDDMLDVSRIRSGKLTIVKEQMDICVATRDVVSRMSAQFSAAGFPVPEVIACESITGNWDLIRIEQVIVNLLTNALRYGEGKQIFVVAEDQNNKAILKVKDQGEGIDVKEHEKIFERFVRSASAKNTGGLGLGLYLTRQIVEAHGGSISLQSTPGQGATFIVELPK